jgi:ribonucleoside-diphosphate reductase alpha chain
MDYIFQYLAQKFLTAPEPTAEDVEASGDYDAFEEVTDDPNQIPLFNSQADAPPCSDCGSIMTRNGSCYKCENCGTTSGCS